MNIRIFNTFAERQMCNVQKTILWIWRNRSQPIRTIREGQDPKGHNSVIMTKNVDFFFILIFCLIPFLNDKVEYYYSKNYVKCSSRKLLNRFNHLFIYIFYTSCIYLPPRSFMIMLRPMPRAMYQVHRRCLINVCWIHLKTQWFSWFYWGQLKVFPLYHFCNAWKTQSKLRW